MKKSKEWFQRNGRGGCFLLLTALLFLSMFFIFGPGVYNDSDQYLKMHIHREPLYPLCLLLLRTVFGDSYLTAMGIIQNLFMAFTIWLFSRYLSKRFLLQVWAEAVLVGISLMPHFLTKYFSSLHLFMTSSVMSEAICLPLFTLFLLELLRMLLEGKKSAYGKALLLALLLSLTRNQMMLTLIVWPITAMMRQSITFFGEVPAGARVKKSLRLLCGFSAAILLAGAAFCLRDISVRTYNLVYNDRFIPNTYGPVNTLTNVLYAADREDGEHIKEEEARSFFYRMYDLTEEHRANYKYAGNSLAEKAEHLEQWHDTIKYQMIEDVFYQTYNSNVTSDYITQNLMADETASRIMAGILPKSFLRWFGNYMLLACYGLIRTVAIVNPLLNVYALLLYLAAVIFLFVIGKKGYRQKGRLPDGCLFLGMSLLIVAANAFAVSLTIMALSRYMIYGFVPFYCGFFILLIEGVRMKGYKVEKLKRKAGRKDGISTTSI